MRQIVVLLNWLLVFLHDLYGFLRYDVFRLDPIRDLRRRELPAHITMLTQADTDGLTASASDYPGLRTCAGNEKELIENVNDSILTYFSIPRYIARRTPNFYHPSRKEWGEEVSFELRKDVAVV